MTATLHDTAHIPFDNSYAALPGRFYSRLNPTQVRAPRLLHLNRALAADLGIDADSLATPEGVAVLAGNRIPAGAEPLAMAYAGHQFGNFVPQLGDGRAILLGEVIGRNGRRYDIQLKGSGRTPFSRSGDGRAAVGPVLRELIISEAFAALGIPTTRTLAAVATGEPVARETMLPGAVLTRVAQSHIRVGTFQYFAARNDTDAVKLLADHVIARHYPQAAEAANPYAALLDLVIARQADLVAQWMCVGFIHGVMNTDNCSIAGETIDYGPCAFMDTFHPATVYSSIDQRGRYAYANQPRIAQWNLARLAETLLPLIDTDADKALSHAQSTIDGASRIFEAALTRRFSAKLGIAEAAADDMTLVEDLLERMAMNAADFTLTFRALCDAARATEADEGVRRLFKDPAAFDAWTPRWRARLERQGHTGEEVGKRMRGTNPAFIPRNHQVEAALAAASTDGDLRHLERLMSVLARPYEDQPENSHFAEPPEPDEVVRQTFCGT